MKMNQRKIGLSLLMVFTMAGPVLAQDYSGRAEANLESHYQSHVTQLKSSMVQFKSELQIQGGQEAAWNEYKNELLKNSDVTQKSLLLQINSPATTAAEHYQRQIALKQRQLDNLKATANAFNVLYSQLSASQQKIADQHFAKINQQIVAQMAQ
jgi:hypothetical protein